MLPPLATHLSASLPRFAEVQRASPPLAALSIYKAEIVMEKTLYLFQSGDSDFYGMSHDKTGCSIPLLGRRQWLLRAEIDPEDVEDDLLVIGPHRVVQLQC